MMLNKPFLEPPNDVKKKNTTIGGIRFRLLKKARIRFGRYSASRTFAGHAFLYVLEFGDKKTENPEATSCNPEFRRSSNTET